jgi:predicted RNase H-like HicB family nuclease
MKIVIAIAELSGGMHKAHCPALPGCMVLGRSRQEAVERMCGAVEGYLASFEATMPGKLELEILDQGTSLPGASPSGNASESPRQMAVS